jgi:pyrroloquinoline quinone biosynthesis protein B
MKVKILGSAAGGGFPQWNCACRNCHALRSGTFQGKARSQTQIAVSSDGNTSDGCSWFLLGASPDLRLQIEATPELQPKNGVRQSPIAGAVLANADLDHVLGLLMLRELQPLQIYATGAIRHILRDGNTMFNMLQRSERQAAWLDYAPGKAFSLGTPCGKEWGLRCSPIALGGHFPAYVRPDRQDELAPEEVSLGLFIESASGKRMAFMPAVPHLDDTLLAEFERSDLLLFDGTFWSDDELISVQGGGQTSRQMGHIPVSSPDGSLKRLAGLRHPRKIYLHINNTNPILNEAGPEYRQVRNAGWEIAEDGWQFDL